MIWSDGLEMKEKTQSRRGGGVRGGFGEVVLLLPPLVLHQKTNGGEPTDADWLLSQQCIALRGRHRGRKKKQQRGGTGNTLKIKKLVLLKKKRKASLADEVKHIGEGDL